MKEHNYTEIKKALLIALENFDKEIILEISHDEIDKNSWSNGCEILNNLDPNIIKEVLSTIE